MEVVAIIAIVVAIVSVFLSSLAINRVKKQISEMKEVLTEIKNGNGNRRILLATNELAAPIAYGS